MSKLFFNLNSYKKKFNCTKNLTKEQIDLIALELNVPVHDVIEMEKRLFDQEYSLSYALEEDSGFDIVDEHADPVELIHKNREAFLMGVTIPNAVSKLDDRQRDIINSRYSEESLTLDDLSKKYSVSKERIRQIEVAALRKLEYNLKTISGELNGF